MNKKCFAFLLVFLIIFFAFNSCISPIINNFFMNNNIYAKSEDLQSDIAQLEKDLLAPLPIFTDWRFNFCSILSPSLKKNYEDLCNKAMDLRKLASESILEAKEFISLNDFNNAKKWYNLALKRHMASYECVSAASQIAKGIIVNAQTYLDAARKACEYSFGFVSSLIFPPWFSALVSDSFSFVLEMSVAKAEGLNPSDVAKLELTKDAVNLVFSNLTKGIAAQFPGEKSLGDVYFDSSWTVNCSLIEQVKYYLSLNADNIYPALVKTIADKGFSMLLAQKIAKGFLNIFSSSIGVSEKSSYNESETSLLNLDKVQLSMPQNASIYQQGIIIFSWNPVKNATKYNFIICNNINQTIQDFTTSYNSTSCTFNNEGTYTWQVMALDDYGNKGPWSDMWTLIVRDTASKPYFNINIDRGCGSTYKIGDTIYIVGQSNVTANGTLYSYWSDGSVKTYPVSFTANQTVTLYSSPLAGATGLRKYNAKVTYQGVTYESSECSINLIESTPQNITLTLYICENSVNGPPLSGVTVAYVDGGGHSGSQTTNSSGYVTITGTPGTWSFTASKSGYDTNSWSQSITTTCTKYGYIVKSAQLQPYFKVLFDRGCGSTYKIGDTISIVGQSNVTANGTLYSYWSDGSVKTYPISFTANQTVTLYSSPLAGATGLRRYKAVVTYQGVTYESSECSINLIDSGGTPPPSPTLTATPECNGTAPQIRLNWTVASGATIYRIYRNGTELNSVTGTQFINTSVTAGTTYSYYIRAENSYGYGFSNEVSATAPSNCSGGTLGQVQLSSPSNGATLPPMNVTFIWNSVSNATKYEIIIYNHLGQVALDTTTSNLYITVALGAEETITWKVRAGDNSGNWGSWSSTWSLTIKK